MAKIAAPDATAMNRLFAKEMKLNKFAAEAAEDPQAFKDHEEYLSTLETILKQDKGSSFTAEERDITLD